MPKKRITPARRAQIVRWQRAGAAARRKFRTPESKRQVLSRHRAALKTANTYKRPSPNPQFGAKVAAARKFLRSHGNRAENYKATKPTRGTVITSGSGKPVKVYLGRRRPGPGRGH